MAHTCDPICCPEVNFVLFFAREEEWVDAVLPGGGLLSRALATETVAGAFGLPPAGAAPGGQSGPSGASSSRGPAEGNAVGAFWGARGKGSSDSREGHAEMR